MGRTTTTTGDWTTLKHVDSKVLMSAFGKLVQPKSAGPTSTTKQAPLPDLEYSDPEPEFLVGLESRRTDATHCFLGGPIAVVVVLLVKIVVRRCRASKREETLLQD